GGYENQVLSELLKWMGRKRETKHGWNSLLTNSTSKKELTIIFHNVAKKESAKRYGLPSCAFYLI
ncbi:MAG: hypothetical protein LBF89_10660, partial [Bacteroidales bacterium]|nr:hypothetical protein [Bacteroidales bacterium]